MPPYNKYISNISNYSVVFKIVYFNWCFLRLVLNSPSTRIKTSDPKITQFHTFNLYKENTCYKATENLDSVIYNLRTSKHARTHTQNTRTHPPQSQYKERLPRNNGF